MEAHISVNLSVNTWGGGSRPPHNPTQFFFVPAGVKPKVTGVHSPHCLKMFLPTQNELQVAKRVAM
jgi:hypothetical protein